MSEQKHDYMAVAEKAMKQIKNGAFLTVRSEDGVNTMTIGWAMLGNCWQRDMFMVAVRDSRHTFGIIEKAADFTVSVPTTDMKDKVMFCGTKSGRKYDKFKECGLEQAAAKSTQSPVLAIPGIHFECRILYKTPMNPDDMDSSLDKLYPEKDYHTLYYGEILECYETNAPDNK